MEHRDPIFYGRYGFCRVDCGECKRLDFETMTRPGYDPKVAVAEGVLMAVQALVDDDNGDGVPMP